jgi:hypothetical protein|tara:strand:- start:333 stop:527 length:195 start_codon:yes stop_codon:yes gene_type:complete
MSTDFEEVNCDVCDKPFICHIDAEQQCDECLAYEGRGDYVYNIDYSNKSKLDKYQLKMVEVFNE